MESFTSTKLENGLIKVELTVQPETAQYLYILYLEGELAAASIAEKSERVAQGKAPSSRPPKEVETGAIRTLDDLGRNERTLLAALADQPIDMPLPTSRAMVSMVDWRFYSKSGSDDETARASSLRVAMQKLEKKGLLRRRGLKGNTERYLTDQGAAFAQQARDFLRGHEPEGESNEDELSQNLPDFNPHGRIAGGGAPMWLPREDQKDNEGS